jgi:nicotinamidase-related amidase
MFTKSITKFNIISVDYQNDFCSAKGKYYKERPCHSFIQTEFIPFLKKHNLKIAEIVCDYRLPRPNETEQWCVPGEWGYSSMIDPAVKLPNIWIKSMHSPEWIRENGGNPLKKAGHPYQDPEAFNHWLRSTIGSPENAGLVVLIGLTLDVCVLCTAQQLSFRGYDVRILNEGSDIYDLDDVAILTKNILFSTSHREFSRLITWEKFQVIIKHSIHKNIEYNNLSLSCKL